MRAGHRRPSVVYLFGKEWLLEFEPKKSQGLVVFNTKKCKNTEKLHPPLRMGRIAVKEKKEMEILGLTIDARGNWSQLVKVLWACCSQPS